MEWHQIALIASPFVALAILGVAYWTRRFDHDRSRRQEAIKLMQYWHDKTGADWETYITTVNLLFELDSAACSRIERGAEFSITKEMEPYVRKLIAADEAEPIGDTVSPEKADKIRLHFVKYANLMEIVATAYRDNVADQDMIYVEFRDVFFRNQRSGLATYLRETRRYPAIRFLLEDFEQRDKKDIKKEKIG